MARDPILDADAENLVTWIRVYQRLLLEDVSSSKVPASERHKSGGRHGDDLIACAATTPDAAT